MCREPPQGAGLTRRGVTIIRKEVFSKSRFFKNTIVIAIEKPIRIDFRVNPNRQEPDWEKKEIDLKGENTGVPVRQSCRRPE